MATLGLALIAEEHILQNILTAQQNATIVIASSDIANFIFLEWNK